VTEMKKKPRLGLLPLSFRCCHRGLTHRVSQVLSRLGAAWVGVLGARLVIETPAETPFLQNELPAGQGWPESPAPLRAAVLPLSQERPRNLP